jgi:sterol desaturase/sphingolipid hydroxylase (fatty acid hydroxylase superfamily)
MSASFEFLLPPGLLLWDIRSWPNWFIGLFCVAILLGLEALSHFVPIAFGTKKLIPVRGKHLDSLDFKDNAFIWINKFLTLVFVYHVIVVVYHCPTVKWSLEEATVFNTLGSLVAFYLFYDFFYMNFHRILHFRSLYGLIHKHHHRQKAPSRGNLDAINVHPFEFLVGEYLHLVTIYVIPCHISAVVVFILLAGILASLNHTRFDIDFLGGVYNVKAHDVHHRMPESNYAQYTMFWDKLFGSFRPYNEKDTCKDTD